TSHGLYQRTRFKAAIPSLRSWRSKEVTSPSCRPGHFKPSSGQHHHYDPPTRIRRNIPCIRGVTCPTPPQQPASAKPTPVSYI
ncbi:hypothetical protein QBC45DRAFT_298184, partial [Copromyces sp. CBS 386.78]